MSFALLDTGRSADLRRVRRRLRRFARRAPDQLTELARRQRDAVAEASTREIRAHPLTAAAVLFGAGLVAGALAGFAARR